ncbi:CPBP family intramembrane glutamic endopeptidase [Gracilibacillus phocaeensis]|uniref:CPBP family intramembrane glutamic endopeptidase n=1 Tax=Gracilibacillus phocaeensis TaxID=2042304 RepID=UPI001030DCB5|nr:CPBP family intramembrane glutamic endopeptidase [Gracilibacillus phocaeensis]
MIYIVVSLFALILTFSYRITKEWIYRVPFIAQKLADKYTIYIWGFLALAVAFFVKDEYVYQVPMIDKKIIFIGVVILFINLFVAKYSGYEPVGKYNLVNFVIFYPVFEEIIFRGLILPILNTTFNHYLGEIVFLQITTAIIISAFLFAIAHLQYYELNQSSIRYMVFACMGGVLFGAIADYTQSIVFPILLHVAFNFMAAYSYSKR